MKRDRHALALVYACSGCSSAAQLANHVAVQLDRQGVAEMSCIAGVGGDVPQLVKVATSGRPVVVLDGCALTCASNCLARHGVGAERHYQWQEFGVRKKLHADFDSLKAQRVFEQVRGDLKEIETNAGPIAG